MERSPIKDIEIKYLLKQALTDKVADRGIYMKGFDCSCYYEGYAVYKTSGTKEVIITIYGNQVYHDNINFSSGDQTITISK